MFRHVVSPCLDSSRAPVVSNVCTTGANSAQNVSIDLLTQSTVLTRLTQDFMLMLLYRETPWSKLNPRSELHAGLRCACPLRSLIPTMDRRKRVLRPGM